MIRSLLLLGLLVLSSVARGDAIPPPPESCPHGGLPRSSHAGATCDPDPCPAEGCPRGATCREVEVCVERRACGGKGSGNCQIEVIAGPLEKGACARGEPRKVRTCAPAAKAAGCAVGGGADLPVTLLLLALALLWRGVSPRTD